MQELTPEMRGRMSCEWRNFKSGDLNSFWSYEWSKHGTCAAPLFGNSQVEYFNSTLRLNEQYDLNEALTRGGFNPLSANQATAAQITGLLKQQWGVTPGITCNSGKIYEVKTCFNLQLKPIDCPGGSGCPKSAQSLPYGGPIPQACLAYIDNVPAAGSGPKAGSPPPPGSAAQQPTAGSLAATLLLVAAAAATALLAL
ncbi:hypothetical protein COHA_000998 [Chlorella ohadii]|uniref:Uncharacterized protein n=1 Tax=Chlorella ohadii TaxID=2649997 RepID=A0AAD5H8M6_9CHLO|nr:hypothetical protein COHA_000998 [Chlorella ohadii]